MTSEQRLARVTKPTMTRRGRRPSTGDGLPCPVDKSHGAMLRFAGSSRQWCPSAAHSGNGRFFAFDADGNVEVEP